MPDRNSTVTALSVLIRNYMRKYNQPFATGLHCLSSLFKKKKHLQWVDYSICIEHTTLN